MGMNVKMADNIFFVSETFKRENFLGLEDYYSQFDEQLFQYYVCINADNAFTIETIHPYCGISILYVDMEQKEKVGNNEYTRQLALKQMVELTLYFHAMSHFYDEYKQINESYLRREDEEILQLHSKRFTDSKQEMDYKMNMRGRLRDYFFELYRKVFSVRMSEVNIKRLMMPQYLLAQIIREYERIIESGENLPL